MINISKKIKELMKLKNITQKDFAEQIGMTRNGFQVALANNDFKLSVLEKIATTLDFPLAYFFEEDYISSKDNIKIHNIFKSFLLEDSLFISQLHNSVRKKKRIEDSSIIKFAYIVTRYLYLQPLEYELLVKCGLISSSIEEQIKDLFNEFTKKGTFNENLEV